MAKLEYQKREMFHGNQLLTIGDLTGKNTVANVILGTGLVSVSAMEDKAEVTNYAADDVADHATIAGASLLTGTMKFLQLDPALRISFFGQKATQNGKGYASVGIYPKKIVQYVSRGQLQDGSQALLVTVYPSMSVTSKPTKETETDSQDKPKAIEWTAKVQAAGSEFYTTVDNLKSAEFEYKFVGAEVDKAMEFIKAGGIITPSTTFN